MYLISGGSENDPHQRIVGVCLSYESACERVDRLNESGEGGLYYDYEEIDFLDATFLPTDKSSRIL